MNQFTYLGSLILQESCAEQIWDDKESVYGEKQMLTGKMNLELKIG